MANEIYEIFGKKVIAVQDTNETSLRHSFNCAAHCALRDNTTMTDEQMKLLCELPDYQQRMVVEYMMLDNRAMKLGTFLNPKNEKYTSLPIEEQGDMMMQYHAMVIYKMALYNRLERAGIAKTFIPQHDSCG